MWRVLTSRVTRLSNGVIRSSWLQPQQHPTAVDRSFSTSLRMRTSTSASGSTSTGAGSILSTLRSRGLLSDVTRESAFVAHTQQPAVVYAGFDPTADSLHVGNLLVLIALKHFQLAGHKPICLVGGATGLIGDPSGRSTERPMIDRAALERNITGIQRSISKFLDFDQTSSSGAVFVNNMDWYRSMSAIDFLRDVGRHFRVRNMLKLESVKLRMEPSTGTGTGSGSTTPTSDSVAAAAAAANAPGFSDGGMSFTEFSYSTLQAYDFSYLNRDSRYRATIQIGGADQWGNITAGADLIHRFLSADAAARGVDGTGTSGVFGLTVPLLTTSDGEKFGKSAAGGTVWLNREKTSPYQLYQYFISRPDADVHRLLKLFTFIPLSELAVIQTSHDAEPHKYLAQRTLAQHITRMVHGEDGLIEAERPLKALFSKDPAHGIATLSWDDLSIVLTANVPHIERTRQQLLGGSDGAAPATLVQVVRMLPVGMFPNDRAASEQLRQGGIYLNGAQIKTDRPITAADFLHDRVMVLRLGKKKQFAVRISDAVATATAAK